MVCSFRDLVMILLKFPASFRIGSFQLPLKNRQPGGGAGGAVIEFVRFFPGVQDARSMATAAMPEPCAGVALLVLLAQPAAFFAHGGEPFAVRRHVRKPPIVEIVEGLAQV